MTRFGHLKAFAGLFAKIIVVLWFCSFQAVAQTITNLAIIGPDTLNASAYVNRGYGVLATYSDGTSGFVAASLTSNTSAVQWTGNGVMTVGGLGPATITATIFPSSGISSVSKEILVVDGPDPNLPVPIGCAEENSIGPLYSLGMIYTGSYSDIVPICGNVVLVAHKRLNRIQAIDLFTGTVISNWQLTARPLQMLHAPGSTILYVLTDAGQVVRLDLIAKTTTHVAQTGPGFGLVFGEANEILVICSSGSVSETAFIRLRSDTLEILGTHLTGQRFYSASIGYDAIAHHLFVGSSSGITKFQFNPTTSVFVEIQRTSSSGGSMGSIAISPDGKHVVLPDGGGSGNGYTIFDINTNNLDLRYGEFDTGPYPSGADFRYDGKKLAATNRFELQVFDVNTHVADVELPIPQCDYATFRVLKWSPSGRNLFAIFGCGYYGDFGRLVAVTLPAPLLLSVAKAGPGSGTIVSAPNGVSCGSTCVAPFEAGTFLTLTASALSGSRFAGWGGSTGSAACQGTGPCSMLLNENSGVTAIFASFTTPGAPVNVSAYPGDGRISIAFDPPLNNGGDLVTGYAVSCNSGMVTGQSVSSPIILIGLSNGTTYDCRVAATNSVGAGAASSQVSAIPSSSNTISLVSVKSQKSHGSAGVFALDIDPIPTINGAITIEPRIGSSGHILVFTFSDEVTSFGTISVIDSNALSLDAPIAFKSGAEIVVTTGPVANNSRLIVSIPNVNGSTSVSIAVGFLVGDVTNSRSVNAADIAALKSKIGRPVTANNFWFDLDLSGNINGLDLSIVKAHGGRALR